MNLLQRTARAFGNCVVDDVHLANRFSQLLDTGVESLHKHSRSSLRTDRRHTSTAPEQTAQHSPHISMPETAIPSTPRVPSARGSSVNSLNDAGIQGHLDPTRTLLDLPYGEMGFQDHQATTKMAHSRAADPQDHEWHPGEEAEYRPATSDPWLDLAAFGNAALDWPIDQNMFDMLSPLLESDYQGINNL